MNEIQKLIQECGGVAGFRKRFAKYDIPATTVYDWKSGRRKPPGYIVCMMRSNIKMYDDLYGRVNAPAEPKGPVVVSWLGTNWLLYVNGEVPTEDPYNLLCRYSKTIEPLAGVVLTSQKVIKIHTTHEYNPIDKLPMDRIIVSDIEYNKIDDFVAVELYGVMTAKVPQLEV